MATSTGYPTNDGNTTQLNELSDLSDFGEISPFVERDLLLSLLTPQSQEALNIVQPINPSLPEIYEPLMHAGFAVPNQGHSSSFLPVPPASTSSPPFELYSNIVSPQTPGNSSSDSEMHSPQQEEETKKKQRKRYKTAEEREQERSQQQREASQRYRKKKKQLVESLEKKLSDLMQQNEQLMQEKASAMEMVKKLKTENDNLRTNHKKSSEELDQARQKKLLELAAKLQNGASDDEIREFIRDLRGICRQISGLAECHARMLISPTFVQQLIKAGFFQSSTTITPNTDHQPIDQFAQQLIDSTEGLTEEQKTKIWQYAEEYRTESGRILAERENLLQDLSKYFDQNGVSYDLSKAKHITDMTKMLQAMSVLEYLRKNFSEEIHAAEVHSTRMVDVLTPRQEAQFYLRSEMQYSTVTALKEMWDAIRNVV